MRKTVAIFLVVALVAAPTQADFLNDISNGLSSAANSVSNGVSSAANSVSSGLSTATNAVGNGLSTAANATASGLSTAANTTSKWVSTATGGIRDAYNVSSTQITNWTSDVKNALAPAADSISNSANQIGDRVYNVTTGTYQGVLNTASGSAPAPSGGTTTVDSTLGSSILRTLTANQTGYIQVANSLLVALGQNQTSGVEAAIKSLVNNSTGNTSYPTTPINNTVSLSLAQAIVTGMLTAQNYTVNVNYNGQTNRVNASQVSNVFIAGLQDGLTPCAVNSSSSSNATAGTAQYFANIANACCYLVAQPLTYTEALSQTNGVATVFESSLSNSQNLGEAPSLDLTRCLSNTTQVS